MAENSKIEWTGSTWNPIVGCSVKSPGCTNCYAMPMAARIERMGTAPHYVGTTTASKAGPVYNGHVAQAPESILVKPLHWRKPRKIFVNSMGDLFHENVPDDWIDRVFAVMALAPQHTFQILTKRADRMRAYASERSGFVRDVCYRPDRYFSPAKDPTISRSGSRVDKWPDRWPGWPLPNVWLGVSAEDQRRADQRLPDLLATPAAVRFLSAEPLLGPIDLHDPACRDTGSSPDCPACLAGRLDWIIGGGESGPGARPMHPDWARSLRDQCVAAGVPFFFKQWGEWASAKGMPGSLPIGHVFDDGYQMIRVGRARAGRLLDGREWNEFPEARHG